MITLLADLNPMAVMLSVFDAGLVLHDLLRLAQLLGGC